MKNIVYKTCKGYDEEIRKLYESVGFKTNYDTGCVAFCIQKVY